jgi:hypothetical protein
MENTFTGISGSNQAKLHLMLESIDKKDSR